MTETDWRHCVITERQTGSTSVIIERLETLCDNKETNWRQGVMTETDWRHFVITERQTGSTSVITERLETLCDNKV